MTRPASVADHLIARERERIGRLGFEERVREALALGEQAVDLLVQERGIDRREARLLLARERQAGRRHSVAMGFD